MDRLQEKLLAYIQELEATNRQLILALKGCLQVLSNINPATDDNKWRDMLEEIEKIIEVGERLYEQKPVSD